MGFVFANADFSFTSLFTDAPDRDSITDDTISKLMCWKSKELVWIWVSLR